MNIKMDRLNKIILKLENFFRHLATSVREVTRALEKETTLLRLLKIDNPQKKHYTNYKHYISNRQRVK